MKQIDDAFLTAWITTNSNFGLPTAHENIHYTPTKGTAYAELLILPGKVEPLSFKTSNETTGIFRVILRYPTGETAVSAKTKAEEIIDAFPIGTALTYDGVTARIKSAKRQPGVPEEGWYKIVVTFEYVAFIPR